MTSTLETKAAALEGLDFIETEEDVKAVEAATLKIQSTFRGKKIRSKVSTPKQPTSSGSAAAAGTTTATTAAAKKEEATGSSSSKSGVTEELSRKVAEMQVQDNNNNNNQMDKQHQKQPAASSPPEEEAERAATKIQAGFKGYKTRKELEGKLPGAGSAAGGQQGAADD